MKKENGADDEIWKDIEGYAGMYQVSNFGRVKSVERKVYNPGVLGGSNYRTVPSVIRKPNIMHGYHCVALIVNKHTKVYRIHRLVADAFIGQQPTPEHQVNHIDGNKANNRADNLEWVTPKENTDHAIRTGLRKAPTDETKQKIGAASTRNWKRAEYKNRQSEATRNSWALNHNGRTSAIKNGIDKSKSKRYIRNRNGGDKCV